MAYPSAVERWRSLVSKYFLPEDVDFALWLIEHESSGNPSKYGDGGSSIGLFQLNSGGLGSGMSEAARLDPETNVSTAARAVYGGSGWKPWGGQGNRYKGDYFGAIGRAERDGRLPAAFAQYASPGYSPPGPPSSGSGGGGGRVYHLPVRTGRITAVYGPTDEELDSGYNGYDHFNLGVDFGVPMYTPIYTPVSGTVVFYGNNGGWGKQIQIRDANGNIHMFGHLASSALREGAKVSAGDAVATSGNSGGAMTGPHLSYDVKDKDGKYIDPSPFLGFAAAGDNRNPSSTVIGTEVKSLAASAGSSGSSGEDVGGLGGNVNLKHLEDFRNNRGDWDGEGYVETYRNLSPQQKAELWEALYDKGYVRVRSDGTVERLVYPSQQAVDPELGILGIDGGGDGTSKPEWVAVSLAGEMFRDYIQILPTLDSFKDAAGDYVISDMDNYYGVPISKIPEPKEPEIFKTAMEQYQDLYSLEQQERKAADDRRAFNESQSQAVRDRITSPGMASYMMEPPASDRLSTTVRDNLMPYPGFSLTPGFAGGTDTVSGLAGALPPRRERDPLAGVPDDLRMMIGKPSVPFPRTREFSAPGIPYNGSRTEVKATERLQ